MDINNISNFNQNFNRGTRLPDSTSFDRRNTNNSPYTDSRASSLDANKGPIGYGVNRKPMEGTFKSMDGRELATKDQAFVANKELYKKIGREVRGQEENPNAFNLNNFYKYDKQ